MDSSLLNYNHLNLWLEGKEALYHQLNDSGEKTHFYGGNGLPTKVYNSLLVKLSAKYELSSLQFRCCWKGQPNPEKQTHWKIYASDLVSFLDEYYSEPIVSIAHSQGANAAIIAAYHRPDLFKELILIDPVSVTKSQQLRISLIPWFIKKKLQPFKSALNKSNEWKSPDSLFQHLRKNRAYKRFTDENLRQFAKNSLTKTIDETYQLIFPAKWEAYNYALPINIDYYLSNLKVPIKIIGGRPSLFFSTKIRKKWQQILPDNTMNITSEYGHLLPIEAPEICAKMILQ